MEKIIFLSLQPSSLIEEGINVFISLGRHVTPEILLVTPGLEPIIFSQFLNPYLIELGALIGKKYQYYLKDIHIYLYHK